MTQTTIVQINVSQTIAPTPNRLQEMGAIVTQGGTNTADNVSSLLTQASDLTALLAAAKTITAASWTGGVATYTTSTDHNYADGQIITVAGMTPSGYNVTGAITVVDTDQFSIAIVSDPGSATVFGTAIPASVAELVAAVTTFFAQGANAAVYVLELGNDDAAGGISSFGTYLTNNPNVYYGYLVPKAWGAESTFQTLVGNYDTTTSKVYFYINATLSDYSDFDNKSINMTIEAPTAPATEFVAAASLQWLIRQRPSSTNKVPSAAFAYRLGVTTYPVTNTQKSTFKDAYLNYISTGAEGGISNKLILWGKNADGRPVNYWYSVDWMQINLDLAIANEIINGSNTSINPLYYDQNGINRLQARAANVGNQAVQNGLALGRVVTTKLSQDDFIAALNNGDYAGQVVINAVPFGNYNQNNPTHFALGRYDGLSCVYTPARGFEQIIFNVNVTDFVAATA